MFPSTIPKNTLMDQLIQENIKELESFGDQDLVSQLLYKLKKCKLNQAKTIIKDNLSYLNLIKSDFSVISRGINKDYFNNEVLDYLLSLYQKTPFFMENYASFLIQLIKDSKYKQFEIFLKHNFSINSTMYFENNEYNILLYEIHFEPDENVAIKNVKYLLNHGINVNATLNYDIEYTHFKDLNQESNRIIDFLIRTFFRNNREFSFRVLSEIINFYSNKNKKDAIVLELDNLNQTTFRTLSLYDINLKVLKLIIKYYGINNFFKSLFYRNLKEASLYTNHHNIIHKIQIEYQPPKISLTATGSDDSLEQSRNEKDNDIDKYNSIKKKLFNEIKNMHFESIMRILDNNPTMINVKNLENKTPLMYVAEYCLNQTDIINLLIHYCPDKNITDKNGATALHIACQFNNLEAVKQLITKKNINLLDKDSCTPLMIALKNQNFECAISLLSNKISACNTTVSNKENETPLQYFINNKLDNKSLFKLLISTCNNNENYIDYMLRKNIENEFYFDILIENETTLSLKQFKPNQLINNIVSNKSFHRSILKNGFYLLEKNKKIFIQNPLIFSIKNKLIDFTKSLLDNWDDDYRDINELDDQEKSCLHYAIDTEDDEYLQALLEYPSVNIESNHDISEIPLAYAIKLKKCTKVKLLLLKYIEKYEKEDKEKEKFKLLLENNCLNIYEDLLNNNEKNNIDYNLIKKTILQNESTNPLNPLNPLNLDNKNNNEFNPVMNDKDSDKINNIDMEETKNSSETSDLTYEISENSVEMINTEKESDNKDIDEYNEIHYACLNENEEIINILIKDFQYNVNEPCNDGSTPLLLSLKHGKYKSAEILLENNADISIPDKNGETPLSYLIKHPSPQNNEIINLLLSKVTNYQTNNGLDPEAIIKYLIDNNNTESLKAFISKSKKFINNTNNDNDTPLLYAIKRNPNNLELIEILLSNGADVNHANNTNKNPLIYAIEQTNINLIELLKKYHADINYKLRNGTTPLKLSLSMNNTTIIKKLLEKK
ncbi:ankyrin [Neocallimastix lanati (nom. inval.)]|uniref:Ankyrin n=1 Tax=Neocallimastix californiae TaxID=1754190 RepID=A0A1Y2CS73_9FUNG|nr:ankyrin [Neocallimastix sp. JGI-2020a]ORY49704.1 ankyrin [Neocallimastix californiae]|eukprot:ORY49704.1 ankyrin [Neocallimastix californiae]